MPVSLPLLSSLGQNVCLILALAYVYGLVLHSPTLTKLNRHHLLEGFAFGLAGIVAMVTAIEVAPGFLLDARSIPLLMTGLIAEPIATLVAAVMLASFRMLLGGAGAGSALAALGCQVVLALGAYTYLRRHPLPRSWLVFPGLGAVSTIVMVIWAPLLQGAIGLDYARQTFLPLLLLEPIGLWLLYSVLSQRSHEIAIERELAESEARYRRFTENASDVIYRYRLIPDQGFDYINPAVLPMIGYQPHELYANEALRASLLHPDDQPRFDQVIADRRFDQPVSVRWICHDGSILWVEQNIVPIFDDAHQLIAIEGIVRDITERKHAENQIIHDRDLLRTLLDHLPDYIFVKNAQRRFLMSNAAHNAVAGVARSEDLLGKTSFDVFPEPLASQFDADDQAVLESGQAIVNVERTSIDATGAPRTMLTTKVPLTAPSGQVIGLVGISRDITVRKEYEQQVLLLASEQERVRVLRHVISDLSHDFRTPLAVINNGAYLAGKTTDPAKRAEYLARIEAQVKRLAELLDRILAFSALDQGTFEFRMKSIDVPTFLQGLTDEFSSRAALRQQTLSLDCAPELPLLRADAQQLRQALSNLLENACQYTPQYGQITLRATGSGDRIILTVEDTGIGISPTDLPHIFEYFYRGDPARSMDTGKNGLGLSLARQIVEAHGGYIRVSSEVGQGSTFTVELPI